MAIKCPVISQDVYLKKNPTVKSDFLIRHAKSVPKYEGMAGKMFFAASIVGVKHTYLDKI